MEALLFWLVFIVIIILPIYYYGRWRSKKDNVLALDRIATVRQLLSDEGFGEVNYNNPQYGTDSGTFSPTLTRFEYKAQEDTSADAMSITCFINRPDEDNLNISFVSYSGKGAGDICLGELSFFETRLRQKSPRLCLNKTSLEEVVSYFDALNKQHVNCQSGKPFLQKYKIYGPLKSSLSKEIRKAASSKFALAYAGLYFALVYILLGVSGVSLNVFLVALLLFSVAYMLLVWRYRYLREELFKWNRRRWAILTGIGIIPGGVMFASIIYPFEWGGGDNASFLFFSVLFGIVHGYTQMAIQSLFWR